MGELRRFKSLEEKNNCFSNKYYTKIDSIEAFDQWFIDHTTPATGQIKTNYIHRGCDDARFKLYSSAQRLWIQNDMDNWGIPGGYAGFINTLVHEACDNHKPQTNYAKYGEHKTLFQKVIDTFGYGELLKELIMLSIIQHYSGPTPLMDWTYNLNVALYFATEKLTTGNGKDDIDDYFSIYSIDKSVYRDHNGGNGDFPDIQQIYPKLRVANADFDQTLSLGRVFNEFGDSAPPPNKDKLFYISDFDEGNYYGANNFSVIRLTKDVPLTTVYNQNIVPQEGLFIFNPFKDKPLDEIFSNNGAPGSTGLKQFRCFNIRKDLADYIRRRIKEKFGIDKSYIYPHLYNDIEAIKNKVLNSYADK